MQVTIRVSVAVLPAASLAVTLITFCPLYRVMPVLLQDVVPLHVPLPPRSFDQETWVTPTVSEAAPAMFRVLLLVLQVEFDVGEVIVTVCALETSGVEVNVRGALPVLSAASRAVTVMMFWPL